MNRLPSSEKMKLGSMVKLRFSFGLLRMYNRNNSGSAITSNQKKVATEDKFLFEVIVLKKNFLSHIITSHKTGVFGTFIAQYTTVIKYKTDA